MKTHMLVFHKRCLKDPLHIPAEEHENDPMRAAMAASVRLRAGGDFLVTDAEVNQLRQLRVAYSGPE